MTGPRPDCMDCTHRNEEVFDNISCAAYPDGIPDSILIEGKKHIKIIPGQKGSFTFKAA